MTKEQLLIPRYLCTGTPGKPLWYGCHWKHGDVIQMEDTIRGLCCVYEDDAGTHFKGQPYFADYPHLFKPLPWWYGRTVEELLSLEQKWVDISGYEGLYQVSNLGIVKGLTRTITRPFKGSEYSAIKKERVLLFNKRKDGYLTVQLSKNDKVSTFYVHRLVADAFIPKIDGKDCVNHIDSKRDNPMSENLEWCTHSENLIHAVKYNDYCGKIKNRRKPSSGTSTREEYEEYLSSKP